MLEFIDDEKFRPQPLKAGEHPAFQGKFIAVTGVQIAEGQQDRHHQLFGRGPPLQIHLYDGNEGVRSGSDALHRCDVSQRGRGLA
ncbi:hypothetical protein D3C86_1546850 [compost metagenome]